MMHRTQIYLPEELKNKLERIALRNRTSMAEIIRKAVVKEVDSASKQENPLAHLAKLKIKGGPKDLSKNYKKYLYGQ